jgi:hypothetical protein
MGKRRKRFYRAFAIYSRVEFGDWFTSYSPALAQVASVKSRAPAGAIVGVEIREEI